jgi:NAD-dependent dihydropyrimidine dehydrogenase PreA subunit
MQFIDQMLDVKKGRKKAMYEHPLLEKVCSDTFGVMIYQEQVQNAAKVLAGYTLGGADLLRRAMGKKDKNEMEKQRAMFIEGCATTNGISRKLADQIFDKIAMFAGYGFNKSHSACYGHISELGVASELIQSQGVRVCAHDAVRREEFSGGKDGYHLYTIDDAKCTACGKCTKRCNQLGTKSMFLIIRPDLCLGCNRCTIAAVCPEGAIEWAHSYPEDDFRGFFELESLPADGGGMETQGGAGEAES